MFKSISFGILCTLLIALPSAHASRIYNVELLSHIDEFTKFADIWGYNAPDGREYAIIGTAFGTAFYNVTDVRNPVLVGFVGGPKSDWRDIKTYSSYCYVTTEGGGTGSGMQCIDISDPDNPVLVSTYNSTLQTAHNLYIDTVTAHAYVVGTANGTRILSLANPTAPVEVGSINSPYFHDCMVRDGRFYGGAIYSGQMRIYDVSTPASPSLLSSTGYSGAFTHNVWPTEDGQYAISTDELADGLARVWDISNLSSISQVASYSSGAPNVIIHNVHIRGNIASISHYSDGIRFLDVSDPTAPSEIGYYDRYIAPGGGFKGCWGAFPYTLSGATYASDIGAGLYIVRHDTTYGNVSGTIVSSGDLSLIEDARVTLQSTGYNLTTPIDGTFSIHAAPGNHTVLVERHGYAPLSFPVTLVTGGDSTVSISMTPLPKGSVSGTVEKEGALPVQYAYVSLVGADDWVGVEEYSDTSDASGAYFIDNVPAGFWEVRAERLGQNPQQNVASVLDGQTSQVDFAFSAAIFSDDFESDQGWTVGAPGDDATEGLWERVEPVGREIGFLSPPQDHTPDGSQCFITEQGVVFEDPTLSEVDGTTSLLSPIIDLTGADDPTVVFQRFFAVNIGKTAVDDDSYVVAASSDSGSSWVTIDSTTSHFLNPDQHWFQFEFRIQDYLTLTDGFQVKMVITDQNIDSPVEAGLDDFEIIEPVQTHVGVLSNDTESEAPPRSALLGNRPNPFNPITTIEFQLAEAGRVDLEIYDVTGRLVRNLLAGELNSGNHRVVWDGLDENGRETGSGLYFYRLRGEEVDHTRRMVLIR